MADLTVFDRMCALAADGMIPPSSFLRSPQKTLMWRAMVNGQRFHCHSAKAAFGWTDLKAAIMAIKELREAGVVHVVGWTRNGTRGPMTAIVEFGQGIDVPCPDKLPATFICKRWRDRHPERKAESNRRQKIKKRIAAGTMPAGNDPLLAAIMGK